MHPYQPQARIWLPHPYRRALYSTLALMMLGVIVALGGMALAAAGVLSPGPSLVGGAFATLFAVVGLVAWAIGLVQRARARRFLASERPLVEWTYSGAQWRQVKEAVWEDERLDWRAQWGCLTALLALAGALTGALVGGDENLGEAFRQGAAGLLTGGLVGGALGGAVALSSHLAARLARAEGRPGQVALAPHEVYTHDGYFHGDGRQTRIRKATLEPPETPGAMTVLRLEIIGPLRARGAREQAWEIAVPPEMVEAVQEALDQLTG